VPNNTGGNIEGGRPAEGGREDMYWEGEENYENVSAEPEDCSFIQGKQSALAKWNRKWGGTRKKKMKGSEWLREAGAPSHEKTGGHLLVKLSK